MRLDYLFIEKEGTYIFEDVVLNRFIRWFIKIVISFSLIFYLLQKIGFEKLTNIFYGLDISWFIVALILVTVSNILGVLQWHFLLQSGNINISYKRTLLYYYNGLFFNNFLLSLFGGDIFRVYDISKHSGKYSSAISSVFLDRVIGLMAMATLSVFFGIIATYIFHKGYFLLLTGGFFVFFLLILAFFYFKNFAKKFQAVTEKILPAVVFQKLREVYNSIYYFKNHRRMIFFLFLNSIIIQTLRIGAHYVAALSLNVNSVSIWYFYIFVPIIFVISMLPITIGGLGVRESIGIVLFGYVGISGDMAFSIEFLAYIIGILSSLPGGIAFVITKHEKINEIQN